MHPQQLIKRDGTLADFDPAKIAQALAAAGKATGKFDAVVASLLTERVLANLADQPCPGIETIQNRVEETLVAAGCWRTARAYIVYREQHARLRALQHTLVDVESAMDEYLEQRDWRVNANANQGYSLGGLILNVAGKVTANYWLNHVYSPEAGRAHREGDIHIHDLDMLSGYCAGWSLRQLLNEGFAARIEAGLRAMMESGEFMRRYNTYKQGVLAGLNLRGRRLFLIPNREMGLQPTTGDPEWWDSLDAEIGTPR